jgi:ABC-type nitrate/sulfonate/bicarbonate transport system ATPase subunit
MKKIYAMEELLIKIENVNLFFQSHQVLRDINAEVRNVTRPDMIQGQIVALVGRSGIGKTQLFKILSGLSRPTSGQVLIDSDQHLVTPGEVGIIPQNYILFRHKTIFKNLEAGLCHCNKKCDKTQTTNIIRQYAETFDLIDHLDKYPEQLSGGQRQRVSIIQQVLTDNKFILLDEPFSGLDILMVDKVIQLLIRVSCLNEYNTLLVVSHDIESALAIADTVWVLAKEEGKEGATITKVLDLKAMGFAWDPDIRKRTEFQQFICDVKGMI